MKRKFKQEDVWKNMTGKVYYKPDDLNIFVKRKGLFSWTMNLGNKWSWYIMLIEVILIAAIFCFTWLSMDFGIGSNRIEQDARDSGKIPADWSVTIDTSDILSAMVFHPENKSDHDYRVYINRPGLSFGYFFRSGGHIFDIENSIAEISVEGYEEKAFISLNTQNVAKMEIDNGNHTETILIESTKPFAFVLAKNVGAVTFYDIHGNIVQVMKSAL